MSERKPSTKHQALRILQDLLRSFKESLARRLWAIPAISESEKEVLFKEYLSDLDSYEREMNAAYEELMTKGASAREENELLRSLMGISEDELRTRALTLSQDVRAAESEVGRLKEEREELIRQIQDLREENEQFRRRIKDMEARLERFRMGYAEERKGDIQFFWEKNEALKNDLGSLENQIKNLRELYTQTNEKLVAEKQEEIALLQRKLLKDMEEALRQKQEMVWNEESLFAKGVARRLRNVVVSAQGELFLTLERLGLLDPETKSDASFLKRIRILMEGGNELKRNFKNLQIQFQQVTETLDDYLRLTGLRDISRDQVDLKALVESEMADVYRDRRPALNVEFLCDDVIPSVEGDTSLHRFVVHTLLQNAMEAIGGSEGNIVIQLRNRSGEGYIILTIKDSGGGIPSYWVSKLFQPFFTTKEGRQGLSLSRARRYLELHGGQLKLIHTGVDGTTFEASFPIQIQAAYVPPRRRSSAQDEQTSYGAGGLKGNDLEDPNDSAAGRSAAGGEG